MRLSEMTALAEHVFGPALASIYTRETVLTELDGRTARQALDDGIPVRRVWTALCDQMDVPDSMRWELPPEKRPG